MFKSNEATTHEMNNTSTNSLKRPTASSTLICPFIEMKLHRLLNQQFAKLRFNNSQPLRNWTSFATKRQPKFMKPTRHFANQIEMNNFSEGKTSAGSSNHCSIVSFKLRAKALKFISTKFSAKSVLSTSHFTFPFNRLNLQRNVASSEAFVNYLKSWMVSFAHPFEMFRFDRNEVSMALSYNFCRFKPAINLT